MRISGQKSAFEALAAPPGAERAQQCTARRNYECLLRCSAYALAQKKSSERRAKLRSIAAEARRMQINEAAAELPARNYRGFVTQEFRVE